MANSDSDTPTHLRFEVSFDREEDGRWIAEVEALPGCLAYGTTQAQAARRVMALALQIIAERMDQQQDADEESSDSWSWGVDFEAHAA